MLPPADRILQLAAGCEPALVLEAAVRHRFFDALDRNPSTLAEVAAKTSCSERGVRAILNALVGLHLLDRFGDHYALTPESAAYLVSTSPSYQGHMCKHLSRHILPRWLHLTDVVRTGQPAAVVNESAAGAAYFAEFVEDIFPMSYDAAQALADHLKVAAATAPMTVLDLAAGSGVWSIAMAEASKHVSVTAVDWPDVLPVTLRVATKHHVAARYRFVPGDLLEADFGQNHSIATLGHILHSEGAARSQLLLHKTFASLRPGGHIAIAEFVPRPDRTGPAEPLLFAVTMLVNTTAGDTFTFPEMSQWLASAGFQNIRTLNAPGPSPLLLATKPS